jgi:hypothetical protein
VVGFELGEKFLGASIRQIGGSLLIISVTKVVGTALIVFLVLMIFQIPLIKAIILVGIAPTPTTDIIDEVNDRGEL